MSRKKRNLNTLKLGLFVSTGLVLFIVAVYLIGSQQNLFGANFRLYTVFGNVNGLQPGNNVRFSGINVGTVEDITILNDTAVQVHMLLQEKVKPHIKKDAVASIGSDGLVGSMLVNISAGKGKEPAVEDGDFIRSYSRVEADDILNTLGKTNENIALISTNLLRITERLNRGPGLLSQLLRDSLLAEELSLSLYNLRRTSEHLNHTGQVMRTMLSDIQSGQGLAGQLLRDTTVLPNLNAMIDNLDSLFTTQAPPILSELQRSADEITQTTQTLHAFIDRLNAAEGPVDLLLSDTATAGEIRQTIENLEAGTRRFDQNMEALQHNFLFRGYFRKMERKREREERRAERDQN